MFYEMKFSLQIMNLCALGTPSLFSHAMVFIRVGVPGNQRPVFKGTPYNITLRETLSPNSFITTVRATDPDGPDEAIEYKITAGADNFYIDSRYNSGGVYSYRNCQGWKVKS